LSSQAKIFSLDFTDSFSNTQLRFLLEEPQYKPVSRSYRVIQLIVFCNYTEFFKKGKDDFCWAAAV
jgi:hypothetical protein